MNKYQVEINFKKPENNGAQWVSALYRDFSDYNKAVEFYHKYDNKDFVSGRKFRAKSGGITLLELDNSTKLPISFSK